MGQLYWMGKLFKDGAEGSGKDLTYTTGLKDVYNSKQKLLMCVQNRKKLIFAVLEISEYSLETLFFSEKINTSPK
jgi:hypothetical protein